VHPDTGEVTTPYHRKEGDPPGTGTPQAALPHPKTSGEAGASPDAMPLPGQGIDPDHPAMFPTGL